MHFSGSLLPKPYADLMQEGSEIYDYYPREFETDLNGKTQDWEALVLIPFIDEVRWKKRFTNSNNYFLTVFGKIWTRKF